MNNWFSPEYIASRKSQLRARLDVKKAILKEADSFLASELKRDIIRIKLALMRMEEAQYPFCYHCGVPIEEELLELIPESTYCIQCKAEKAN